MNRRYNRRMKIEGLRKYDGKNPNGYFNDLPPQARMAAWRWLARFETKWRGNLPRWRRAILIGNAKRLAKTSEEERSAWGRSMLAKRGGLAVQRKYAADGIVERDDKKTIPPCVYYSVSSYGRTLVPVVEMMCNWGRSHLKRLSARR